MGICGSTAADRRGPVTQAQAHSMVKKWMFELEMYRDNKLLDIKTKDQEILSIVENPHMAETNGSILNTYAICSLKLKKQILLINFAIQCFKGIDGLPAALCEYLRKPDHPAATPVIAHVCNLVYIGTKQQIPQVNDFVDLVSKRHGESEIVKANKSEAINDTLKGMLESLGKEPQQSEVADYVTSLQNSVQKKS